MKAAVLHTIGSLPTYEDFPDPVPASDEEILITVTAAAIKNIEKMMASGEHYDTYPSVPVIVGFDGVGITPDGTRVLAGGARPPYGMMAEKAVVPKAFSMPLPDSLDDATAAALLNPALSSYAPLLLRARMQPGETVLILGATGVAGKLAVQIAKHLGAGYVIAAGRNAEVLKTLPDLGADAVISLDQPDEQLKAAFTTEHSQHPINIVLDYIWGHSTEVLLDALTGHDLEAESHRVRYVEIGESGGSAISLKASTLRSSAIELYGSGGGSISREEIGQMMAKAVPEVFGLAAAGKIRIDTVTVPLSDITSAWQRTDLGGKRLVVIP